MAPIDPVQLLKALAPLLSPGGGINGIEKAPQFASLMKKFSKKLVSRCVYCNVLKATAPEILARFLEEGGWNTINMWLNDAKENSNHPFLLELLELCRVLPMTVERLKENSTPKVVKALTKYDNSDIKVISNELVTRWMIIIKGDNVPAEVTKKKRKLSKDSEKEQKDPKKVAKLKEKEAAKDKDAIKEKDKEKKDGKKVPKESVVSKSDKKTVKDSLSQKPEKNIKESLRTNVTNVKESPKRPEKLKGTKRVSSEKDLTKTEMYEDVKIKIDAEPVIKKPKVDRPKTVKSYQTKFRATGLEEEVPLPKKINKKNSTVDKNAAAALAKSAVAKRLNSTLNERITEKKIKPENLLNINEAPSSIGGIKLIPAKPRPAHILHESASFMDALVATPAALPKRKKKPVNKPPTPTTPPSPTLQPPKLQFYKDTLEMNSEESESKDSSISKDSENAEKESPSSPPKEEQIDSSDKIKTTVEDGSATPNNDDEDTAAAEVSINQKMKEESKETVIVEPEEEEIVKEPGQLVSILAHGKRRHKRKTVRWVEDDNLKQTFYFELDETERVNVLRNRPFGDLKSIEAKREREAFEAAKRHAGDRMEEQVPWWTVPILIDIPPPLVIPGCFSHEKEIQHIRQQSILQEIYFTREMVPDSPQEPDIEVIPPQEPKIIPLDEENIVGSILDYSTQENPKPKTSLPEVLSSLIKIPSSHPLPQQDIFSQLPIDPGMPPQQHLPSSASPTSPYDPGEPVGPALLGVPPPGVQPMFNSQPQMLEPENMPMPNNWGHMENNMMPPDPYYQGYPMNQPMMMDGMPPVPHSGGNNGGSSDGMRMRMNAPMMGRDMYRPNMMRGGPYPMKRPSGPKRRTVPCRHFAAGNCRFGASCSFLHPGVNGPPL